jgi:hypothetical protein
MLKSPYKSLLFTTSGQSISSGSIKHLPEQRAAIALAIVVFPHPDNPAKAMTAPLESALNSMGCACKDPHRKKKRTMNCFIAILLNGVENKKSQNGTKDFGNVSRVNIALLSKKC